MPRVAAMLLLLSVLPACPRHHDPPQWQPSIHDPPPAAPFVAPPAARRWSPAPPPAPPQPPPEEAPPAPPPGGPLAEVRSGGDGGTVNGDPHGPRAADLEAVVRGATPALQRCVDAGPLPTGVDVAVRVAYRILNVGRIGAVEVQGPLPPDVVACLKAVFDGLRFPSFDGEPISAALPFRFRRDLAPVGPN